MSLAQFCGSRLKDARVARGMTASLLAERVGVSSGAISQYEHQQAVPKPNVLARVAATLSLPEPYFLRTARPAGEAPYLYRSRSAATKRARESAEVRHRWFLEIAEFVNSSIELPEPNVADLSRARSPQEISSEQIEDAAIELRQQWGLGEGPIGNVVLVSEAKGCAVSRFAFGADDLSSFSHIDRGPTIALNSDRDSAARGRFDCAHEIGHLVLHRSVPRTDAEKPEIHKLMESQAHRFAAAFLFPASAFVDEVYATSFDALLSLKKRWKVSVQMMVRRARDLELINQDKYERTYRELSRRGYRTREPLDDDIPTERPSVVSRGIQMMIEQRLVTREELCYRLPFDVSDIEILAQLPTGFLASEKWGELVELRERSASGPSNTSANHSNNVLQFPKR